MQPDSAAYRTQAGIVCPGDSEFDAAFYAPYEAAAQAAFRMLCAARSRRPGEVLSLQYRLKSPESIRGKLRKKGLPETRDAAGLCLQDVAGLRAVLINRGAVYSFARELLALHGGELEAVDDYIAAPKESGYRSLHLVLRVPVGPGGHVMMTPAEIQLRTPGMDAWANLEHRLIYKPAAHS